MAAVATAEVVRVTRGVIKAAGHLLLLRCMLRRGGEDSGRPSALRSLSQGCRLRQVVLFPRRYGSSGST